MVATLDELIERIHRAVVHDAFDANDITSLIHKSLSQRDAISKLAADNQRLTNALDNAGKHIEKLEGLEPMTHLIQYTEQNA